MIKREDMIIIVLVDVSFRPPVTQQFHYNDVTMGSMASQITSLTIVYSGIYSGNDQRKHQCSASLAFVRGIPRGPMFPFHDVIT